MATYDRYCSSCDDGCEASNTCNKCNSCELCNNTTCEEKCILIQAFCSPEGSGQSAGGFSFKQCVTSNETFLTKANWNRLIKYINDAYNKGDEKDGGDSGLPESDDNTFMTAEMFNKVALALGGLGSQGPDLYVYPVGSVEKPEGDIILGSYFVSLESYANALKYTTLQCDNCNDSCDVTCKECQKCNGNGNCEGCNGSCQDHSPNYRSSCETCNTCQDACQKAVQTPPPTPPTPST